jgi:hypothetical protein
MGFQIGFPALRNYPPSGGVTYDADVQAWIDARAAVSDPVGTAYANAVNQYVLDLKAISGHWDTITQLVVFAGVTTVAGGLVPIKGASLTTTSPNDIDAADFNLRTGVAGDGGSEWFETGYDETDFGQDDIHAYCLITAAHTSGNGWLFGIGTTANGSFRMRWNTNTRCNSSFNDAFSSTGVGGYGMSRNNSANYERMAADSVSTVTRASATPAAGSYRLGTTSNITSGTDARFLVWACGPATTLANYTTPGNDLQTALNAIP